MNCPYCNSNVSLKDSSIIYRGKSYGNVWICDNYPECDAYVGVHKETNEPLGRLANPELREWKKKAHAAFDPIWKNDKSKRDGAYKKLQLLMGLNKDDAHIGKFNVEQCKTLIEKLK